MRFQRVSAGGGVLLAKITRLAGSESNHRTAKDKIFPRNGRSRFKSRSAEAWITRFPVRWSLVSKFHRSGLKIPRLPAQICLSRYCIMRIANGWDSKLRDSVRSTKTKLGRGGRELLPICKSTPWKMGLTSLHWFQRFVTFVHLPFSVRSLDPYVASLLFMKDTSCCVVRRNVKQTRAVRSCYGKF